MKIKMDPPPDDTTTFRPNAFHVTSDEQHMHELDSSCKTFDPTAQEN